MHSHRDRGSLTTASALLDHDVLGPDDLLARVERRRQAGGVGIDAKYRAELGQYFTPSRLAAFMAELFTVTEKPARLLDPGAGVGSLTAAVVARWHRDGGGSLDVTAIEADPRLREPLTHTMEDLGRVHDLTSRVLLTDFVAWASDRIAGFGRLGAPSFDLAILNPPYRKIHSASTERRRLSAAGIEVPNLYAGFVALAAELLADGGQLVAITPRSFTNGPYFRRFRRFLLDRVSLRRVHVFDSRDLAFADDGVLQENVIIHAVRGGRPSSVVVSSSTSVSDAAIQRAVEPSEIVRPDDPEAFIHLPTDAAGAEIARRVLQLPCTVPGLDLAVSTGPVVDFRAREYLRQRPAGNTVPLIYPTHLRGGRVVWPLESSRKPNALVRCEQTERLLYPAGTYVLVKRFSAKEERRRVVATVVTPDDLPTDAYAFENHLNVFHRRGRGMPAPLAHGLAAYLNTTAVDRFLRQFNGHTQVNATDLRSLRYPTVEELEALGRVAVAGMRQDELDTLAAEFIAGLGTACPR